MESCLNINCRFIVCYKQTLYSLLVVVVLRSMISDLLKSAGVDDVYVRGDLYAGKYKPDKAVYQR